MRQFFLALLVLIFLCPSAQAVLMVGNFSGYVSEFEIEGVTPDMLPPEIAAIEIGDRFSGKYWFDSENPERVDFSAYFPTAVMSGDYPYYEAYSRDGQDIISFFDSSPEWTLPYASSYYDFDDLILILSGSGTSLMDFEFDTGRLIVGMYNPFILSDWAEHVFIGTIDQFNRAAPVPEPSTILLLGLGIVGLAAQRARKAKH